jgi:hypothetical protein
MRVLEVLRQPLEDKLVTISRHCVVQAGARQPDLPGLIPVGGSDESVPVRLLRRSGQALHLLEHGGDEAP